MSQSHTLRAALNHHFALCKTHASRLANDGDVEQVLVGVGQWGPQDKERVAQECLQTIRLARNCDHRLAVIENFSLLERNADNQAEALEEILATLEQADDEESKAGKFETEVRFILGMPVETNMPEGSDDEEDLEIVGGPRSEGAGGGLRCPLTCKLLEDPVKNSVCGHAYSKAAILSHLAISRKCPVAGCGNRQVQQSHLVADVELTQLVRRQKRREDAEKEQRQLTQVMEAEEEGLFDNDDEDIQLGRSIPGSKRRHSSAARVKAERLADPRYSS